VAGIVGVVLIVTGGKEDRQTPPCPAGATAGAKYCSDLVGGCVGPGAGMYDYVNGKSKYGLTRPACRAECDANPACVGYDYAANAGSDRGGFCFVHGPGLDTDLAGGWTAATEPDTTIVGATGWSGAVCAAVVGRN
jgi:hypothetical protein